MMYIACMGVRNTEWGRQLGLGSQVREAASVIGSRPSQLGEGSLEAAAVGAVARRRCRASAENCWGAASSLPIQRGCC